MVDTSIDDLPKTSAITIRRLKSLGINTYWDLLNYFPSRFEDYSHILLIAKARPGQIVTISGEIIDAKYEITRRGTRIQRFKLADKSGSIDLIWFNQPYLLSLIRKGEIISVAGEISFFGNKLVIIPKAYEIGEPFIHTGRIVPIYSEKRGLSSKTIREKINYVLGKVVIEEFLPKNFIDKKLLDENSSYRNIHFPENISLSQDSRKRLSFDELFTLQLSYAQVKKQWETEKIGNQFKITKEIQNNLYDFVDNLPFTLTFAQKKVWLEILNDLKQKKPMNRFLQGEVGSGKTVVAALVCYLAYLNGYQSLIMAPTEILAFQHYQTISNLFKNYQVKIALVTGSKKSPHGDIIIGTQALIQKKIIFKKVGLVIIDEQHRFGVNQRGLLEKKGITPHLLTMTATPIPRTVALTIYGELDLSFIDEMPKNRLPIKTYFVPKIKRTDCYKWIGDKVKNNHDQAFIICPLIEESEAETMQAVRAAKKEFLNLQKIFPHLRLSLLHGKMKTKEKDLVMNKFKDGKTDILISTPVVEVGIDIPNATIMLIEAVERFGLAALHQLRGRVGRGQKQSYCFLFSEKEDSEIVNRLKFFAKTSDGNLLADADLKRRGPGELFGKKQHGSFELKIADFSDFDLIKKIKNSVEEFSKNYELKDYPELQNRIEKYEIDRVARD